MFQAQCASSGTRGDEKGRYEYVTKKKKMGECDVNWPGTDHIKI